MNGLKWTVGNVELFQVVEVNTVGPAIQNAIPMATPQDVKKIPWLYPHFADESGILKSSNQSFIVKTKENVIVVDTCDGNGKVRSDLPEWSNFNTKFLENFLSTGVTPEEVTFVISTHLHCDHVGFNTLKKDSNFIPTFPKAKYLFVDKDYEYWKSKPEKEMAADKEAFDDSVEPIVTAGLSKIVNGTYVIDESVKLIPTAGHTPGHVAVVIESNSVKAILSGDIIHHPCQIAHPDWKMLADVDSGMAVVTRKQLLDEIADTNTLLLGTHFANPVAGKVTREKEGFAFKI